MTRGLVLLACGALAGGAFGSLEAQCRLQVNPQPEGTGYRDREYGCEGLTVQTQSAPLNIQVISLVRKELRLPSPDSVPRPDSVLIFVPESLPGLRPRVDVIGRGRLADVTWALDGAARPDSAMTWRLKPVIQQIKLGPSHLGVFGETRRTNGLGGPVYIPLDVGAAGSRDESPEDLELVIRIPNAGAAQYRLPGETRWTRTAHGPDGDGYLTFTLPAGPAGVTGLEVRWRPSGGKSFGAPESLDIYFW